MRRDRGISRREFFQAALAAGAGAVLSGRRAMAGAADRRVALVRGTDCDRMVRRAVGMLGGPQRFVFPGARVVVKPNASFANAPEWGNNTNPAVVRAVCKLFREAGARRVTVLDYPLMRGAEALDLNGVAAACKDLRGVDLRVLSAAHQFRPIAVPGKVLKTVSVAREVLDADLLVNLPVAKAHDAVAASIGLKNLMGLIWDRAAFHTVLEINQAIADLALAIRPSLTIVDMTRVLTTNGPQGPGEIATPEMLVASVDPVAADSVAVGQVRFNGRRFRPKQLRYLVHAHQAGLGEVRLGEIDIRKEDA